VYCTETETTKSTKGKKEKKTTITEEIVYVGLTTDFETRHKNGHKVSSKLLNPMYNSCQKKVYVYSIRVPRCDYTTGLEFFRIPNKMIIQEYAVAVLNCIESQLIMHFQPIFNTDKRDKLQGLAKIHEKLNIIYFQTLVRHEVLCNEKFE